MTEQWKWASYKRVKEAAAELKELIRTQFPDAEFEFVRSAHGTRVWNLLVYTTDDAFQEISDLVVDRESDMLSEEHIPIHVIPLVRTASSATVATMRSRKVG